MFKTTALDSVANAYVDKNVGTSTPGTRLEADDRNIIQDELVAEVESSGQTLDAAGTKRSQNARAMFLNGVGAQSLVDSGAANAKVLVPVTGASGYVFGESYAQLTGAAFIFKNLVTNTGATTVNVGQTAGTLIGVKDLTQAGGVAFVGGELVAGKYYLVLYDLANDRFELVTFESFSVSRGHLDGLIMSNGTDTAHDIDIAIGEAADSTGAYLMRLTSGMTKQIDAAWAVGDNAGGMFTGSVAIDTWYHVHEIRKDSDGTIDFGFDTDITASNKPAGYSNYQRIGSVLTDGSSNIIQFIQKGDRFTLLDRVVDFAGAIPATTIQTVTITTPLGIETQAIIVGWINDNSNNIHMLFFGDSENDAVPSSSLMDIVNFANIGQANSMELILNTDASSQIRYRSDFAGGTFKIFTKGWIDPRGKDV